MICLYGSTVVPDMEKEQEWTPVTGPLLALKQEDQLLVRKLGHHVLNGENSVWSLGEAPQRWLVVRALCSEWVSVPAPPPARPTWDVKEWDLPLPLRSGAAREDMMEPLSELHTGGHLASLRHITSL